MPSDAPVMANIYDQAIHDRVHANCDTPQYNNLEKFSNSYFFGDDRYACLINESDTGDVNGWGALKKFSALPGDDSIAEVAVYISRDHRTVGIGVRLLKALIAHAKTAHFDSLIAIILENNAPSIRGCLACGFTSQVRMPAIAKPYGESQDILWMQMCLNPEI
jgi:phosphinothricin acetyltransferase